MRLDVALFELRLFKSRSASQDAIAAGHVELNGRAAKPSHALAAGDRVTLRLGGSTRTLEVLELPRPGLTRERAHALVREVAG